MSMSILSSQRLAKILKDYLSLVTQNDLELLGHPRQTTIDQRRFLTRIETAYQIEIGRSLSLMSHSKL